MMNTGERIKLRRKELKLTQKELGRLCHVSHSAVGLWESGTNQIGGENLVKAATALKTTPEWIINGATKKAEKAADVKFLDLVMENIEYLSDEERQDIEKLISLAKARQEISDKYK